MKVIDFNEKFKERQKCREILDQYEKMMNDPKVKSDPKGQEYIGKFHFLLNLMNQCLNQGYDPMAIISIYATQWMDKWEEKNWKQNRVTILSRLEMTPKLVEFHSDACEVIRAIRKSGDEGMEFMTKLGVDAFLVAADVTLDDLNELAQKFVAMEKEIKDESKKR